MTDKFKLINSQMQQTTETVLQVTYFLRLFITTVTTTTTTTRTVSPPTAPPIIPTILPGFCVVATFPSVLVPLLGGGAPVTV